MAAVMQVDDYDRLIEKTNKLASAASTAYGILVNINKIKLNEITKQVQKLSDQTEKIGDINPTKLFDSLEKVKKEFDTLKNKAETSKNTINKVLEKIVAPIDFFKGVDSKINTFKDKITGFGKIEIKSKDSQNNGEGTPNTDEENKNNANLSTKDRVISIVNDKAKDFYVQSGLKEQMDKLVDKVTMPYDNLKKKTNSIFEKITSNFNNNTSNALDNIDKLKCAGSEALKPINTLQKNAVSVFDKIKDAASNKIGQISETVGKTFNNISTKLEPIKKSIGEAFNKVKEPIGKFVQSVGDKFSLIKDKIGSAFQTIAEPIKNIAGQLFEPIKNFATNLSDKLLVPIKNYFGGIFQQLSGFHMTLGMSVALIALVVGALMDLWNNNEEWRAKVEEAWANIQEILSAAYTNFIEPIFNSIKDLCMNVWENGLQPLWNQWVEFINVITSIFLDLWNTISPMIIEVLNIFGPVFEQLFGALATMIGNNLVNILSIFTRVFGGIINIFKGIIEFVTGVFSGDWERAWEGVKQIFSGIWESLAGIVGGAWNVITGLFTNGGEFFVGITEGIGRLFKDIFNKLSDGINSVLSTPIKFLNSILNKIRDFDIPLIGKVFYGLWGYDPIPITLIPKLASGGFVSNMGQLFIANEPGNPELIGNIGGRTAVVNNQMILDGIHSAMRSAIIEGMQLVYNRDQRGDMFVDVYIDGVFTERKLMQANQKHLLKTGRPVFMKG